MAEAAGGGDGWPVGGLGDEPGGPAGDGDGEGGEELDDTLTISF